MKKTILFLIIAIAVTGCSRYGRPDPCYPKGKDWAVVRKVNKGWKYTVYTRGHQGRVVVCELMYECLPDSLMYLVKK